MQKIMREMRIKARDSNCVFVVSANARRLSPVDAEIEYGIARGRGGAYVDFDIDESRIEVRDNPAKKRRDMRVFGDIDLTAANPVAYFNRSR